MKASNKVVGLDACAVRQVDQAKVKEAKKRLIDSSEAWELSELFRLLGDPTRARILYALVEAGEMCVCDIAASVEVSETACSHALRLLRTAGVVKARRGGRMIYYSLDDAHVRVLLDLSREHLRHTERSTR